VLIALTTATLAYYPNGGGHWTWFLQYPLGLKDLGHRIFWLEILHSTRDREQDRRLVEGFFQRISAYGLERDAAVIVTDEPPLRKLEGAEIYGKSEREVAEMVHGSDLLWNFWYAVHEPLLSQFRYRAFIDVDPGHLQICAAGGGLSIGEHDTYFTVGSNIHEPGCEIPTLGLTWRPFRPFVYLPMWQAAPNPDRNAPFSSITQWNWEELPWRDGTVDVSKRSAYLKYMNLPQIARRPFELAANIGSYDPAGDRVRFTAHGWKIVDPNEVAASPSQYQEYIRSSRAEFMCPKPIHVVLQTGWFSDRSVAYLASGRPVLAEDSGFSQHLPTGAGIVTFRNIEEAVAGTTEIDSSYEHHRRAARALAEDVFDSRMCLRAMLST
jgi:hypothetical protein